MHHARNELRNFFLVTIFQADHYSLKECKEMQNEKRPQVGGRGGEEKYRAKALRLRVTATQSAPPPS